MRRLAVICALFAATAADAQNRGVPQNGFPIWQERMLQVLFNRTRAQPTGTGDPNSCNASTVRPPFGYVYNLNRSARFHSSNLSRTGCFQHNSPCLLQADISARFPPNGTCDGSASCACTNTVVCNASCTATECTQTFTRISMFGTGGSGEIIAGGYGSPRSAWSGWMNSSGHCGIITGGSANVGTGWLNNTWTGNMGGGSAPTGTLIAGGHEVGTSFGQFTNTTAQNVGFRVNYYNTAGAPQTAEVNIDGACTPMTLERGSATNATYLATVSLTGTTCRRYVFVFKDPAGATVRLPETGTYGVGGALATCPDWQSTAPSACPTGGNQAPTIATAAAASPSPAPGTTTLATVLGADDGGEAALTYTWSATGPAAVSWAPNGTNAAKSSTATFTAAGAYTLTATVRDAQGVSVTSSVSLTVSATATSVAVAPGTASVPVLGTQQFTGTVRDQFGAALASQPPVGWSTSGGGSIAASGLYTAGSTPGGPYSVTATSGPASGSAVINVTAGSPPTIATAAAASPSPATGTTTALSVLGADDGGEGALTYTWTASGPAGVTYSANGTNAAKTTTATFGAAGAYTFTVTVRDAAGLTATSAVTVAVNQTLTGVVVSPAAASVVVNGTRTFTATGSDQFGAPLATAPTWAWTVSGGGTISTGGVFTAAAAPGGPFTVTASSGGRSGTAQVTVTAGNAPTVATPAAASPSPATGSTTALSVLGADDGGEAALRYTWSASGPAAVSFSANGTNGAKASTATFTRAGSYTFTVTITDAGGQTVSSTVVVQVQQRLTSVAVNPATASVPLSGTFTFAASARDQFANAMAPQPSFAWTVSGGGTIGAATGLFTAGSAAGGPFTVTATASSVSGTAQVTVANGSAPSVAAAAAASPNPVTGTTTTLSVLGADDGGEAALVYTWSSSGPAAVLFSANGTNGAKSSIATFVAAGSYTFTATLRDAGGLVATSSVTVAVQQTETAVAVLPASATTPVGGTVAFAGSAADQFGAALTPQPNFAWTAAGGGTISTAGVFTATTAGGPFTVTATAGAVSGTAQVTVASGPDLTPPSVAITDPADGATVSGVVVIAATAADDRGVARVDFLVDGVSVGSATTAPYAASWNSGASAAGTAHLLTARATDTSGNVTSSAEVVVTVGAGGADVTAPAVAITSPADRTVVRGHFTATATASDAVGVVRVVFLLDGAEVGVATAAPYGVELDAAALSLGEHRLVARASDAAQNEADSAPVTLLRERPEDVIGTLSCDCSSSGGGLLAWLALALLGWRRPRQR